MFPLAAWKFGLNCLWIGNGGPLVTMIFLSGFRFRNPVGNIYYPIGERPITRFRKKEKKWI